jgi:fluoride ion exporter CrcB/FEX
MNGFCGCLTTVSAFIVELHSLKATYRWRYGLSSIFLGLLIVVLVVGAFVWSKNLKLVDQLCS